MNSGYFIALLLPAFVGISWARRLWERSHWSAIVGYGYLLGMFITISTIRLWDAIGLTLTFSWIAGFLVLFTLPALLGIRPRVTGSYTRPALETWQRIVWWMLLSIVFVRYGGMLLEITWRPLYPWDAWMNWAPKAKVWFELKELTPFVPIDQWIGNEPSLLTYTLGSVSLYPPLVPLVQTWTALGLDGWTDNLVNLPWVLCAVALGLGFYGQSINLGAKPHVAMLFTFLLLTFPYINVHVALAGYADIWLAAYYGLACLALISWMQTREAVQAAFAIVFALACIQTKTPGMIWALTLVPATLIYLLPRKFGYFMLGLAVSGLAIILFSGGFSLEFPVLGKITLRPEIVSLTGVGEYTFEYHSVWNSFLRNGLVWDNWHILWILAIAVIVAGPWSARFSKPLIAANILILSGLLFLFIVFFFTSHYAAALDNTTINRATLHMLPLLVFYLLFIFLQKNADASETSHKYQSSPLPTL